MKRLIALLFVALALGGCMSGQTIKGSGDIYYQHDDAHGVGCWTSSHSGIYCLPDKDYQP